MYQNLNTALSNNPHGIKLISALLISAIAVKILKRIASGADYAEDIDHIANSDNIVELSTCIVETTCIYGAAADQSAAGYQNQPPPGEWDTLEPLFADYDDWDTTSVISSRDSKPPAAGGDDSDGNDNLIMAGPDGTKQSGTAIYVREKTMVTNHRRVMHRQKKKAIHAMVAEIKLRLGTPVHDRANILIVRKMAKDLIDKHKVHPKDAASMLPRVVSYVFIPNDDEIIAGDILRSDRAKQRQDRLTHGKDSIWDLVWSVLGYPSSDPVGRTFRGSFRSHRVVDQMER